MIENVKGRECPHWGKRRDWMCVYQFIYKGTSTVCLFVFWFGCFFIVKCNMQTAKKKKKQKKRND